MGLSNKKSEILTTGTTAVDTDIKKSKMRTKVTVYSKIIATLPPFKRSSRFSNIFLR